MTTSARGYRFDHRSAFSRSRTHLTSTPTPAQHSSSRNRNNLRANDCFTRRINAGGGNPDICVYYLIDAAVIDQRPTNAAIDTRYRAIVYTPGDGQVVALIP